MYLRHSLWKCIFFLFITRTGTEISDFSFLFCQICIVRVGGCLEKMCRSYWTEPTRHIWGVTIHIRVCRSWIMVLELTPPSCLFTRNSHVSLRFQKVFVSNPRNYFFFFLCLVVKNLDRLFLRGMSLVGFILSEIIRDPFGDYCIILCQRLWDWCT